MERLWEIVLANAGQRRVLSLRALLRCGRVSLRWREAVLAALRTLRTLDFGGCEARITGPDVLAVLARVAGRTSPPSIWPAAGGSAPRTWKRSWHAWPRRARVLRQST